MRTRYLLRFLLALLMAVLWLCACQTTETQSVLIAGSSTMVPLAEKLANAFQKDNRSVSVVCEGGGSTAGIVALRRGVIDIALMSRDVRDAEDAHGIIAYPYARNAVAFVVHASNPIEDLTLDKVRAMLIGDVVDWEAVNGKKGPIRVVSRKPGSTTLQSVNDLILFGEDLTEHATAAESAAALIKMVADDSSALGFISYADFEHIPAVDRGKVKVPTVGKVPMRRETILSGRYPLTRVMHFVVNEKQTPAAEAFVAFTRSTHGRRITAEQGLIPVW